jgi:hypothetical protein
MIMRSPARRTTSRPEPEAHLCTAASSAEAARLAADLAAYAVEAQVEASEDGHVLRVPAEELPLARHILGLPMLPSPPAAPVHRAGAASRGLRRRLRRVALAVAAGATSSLAFAAGLSMASPSGLLPANPGWSASGLAYHEDRNGDGVVERIVEMGQDGLPRTVWLDVDRDGSLDRRIRIDPRVGATSIDLDDDLLGP